MMFCIYPIVAEHFEMFFGDMDNQFFDEAGMVSVTVLSSSCLVMKKLHFHRHNDQYGM